MENILQPETQTTNYQIVVTDASKKPVWAAIEGFKSFNEPISIQEALKETGCDFTVKKEHMIRIPDDIYNGIVSHYKFSTGPVSLDDLITTHMATVNERDNSTLGIVGADYAVVQNEEAFKFIDLLTKSDVEGGKPIIETCGSFDEGRRLFLTAKMPKHIRIEGDKEGIDDYVVFHTSHDGSSGVSVCITPIRVVCQNTLNAALKSHNKITFKHTKNVSVRMNDEERVKRILGLHEKFLDEFVNSLHFLRTQPVTENDVKKFAAQMVIAEPAKYAKAAEAGFNLDSVNDMPTATKYRYTTLRNAIESGIGQDEHRGSKLWLYNGITTYYRNYANFGNSTESPFRRAEKRFVSTFEGAAANKVQLAYETLMA